LSERSNKPLRILPAVVVVYALPLILPVSASGGYRSSGAAVLIDMVSDSKCPFLDWAALLPNLGFMFGIWCIATLQWGVARFAATLAVVCGLLVPAFLLALQPDQDLDLGVGYYLWLLSFGLLAVAAWVKSR
jgi:hypothetical protein